MIISGTTISNTTITDIQSALYSFTSFTFTNDAQTGNTGPNLSQSLSSYDTGTYSWLNNSAFFTVNNGIQLWTVPATGNYTVEAYGASGGYDSANTSTRIGRGAYIKGTFTLTQGDQIKILVGQQGSANVSPRQEYGGGGGSFVVKNTVGTPTTSDILVIAGGGGGVGGNATSFANAHGSITTNGNASSSSTLFGNSGNGGGSSNQTVQGGAGFLGNGTNTLVPSNNTPPPQAFVFGGNGGNIKWSGSTEISAIKGGFGGGGSSNRFQSGTGVPAMGGGGGYSGGAAGYGSNSYFGGGGGSYNNGSNQTNTSNVRIGNGSVIITQV